MINWKTLDEKPYAPLADHSRKLAAEGCVLLKNAREKVSRFIFEFYLKC